MIWIGKGFRLWSGGGEVSARLSGLTGVSVWVWKFRINVDFGFERFGSCFFGKIRGRVQSGLRATRAGIDERVPRLRLRITLGIDRCGWVQDVRI